MKNILSVVVTLVVAMLSALVSFAQHEQDMTAFAGQLSNPHGSSGLTLGKLPAPALLFTENCGQVVDANGGKRPDILFSARSGDLQFFITATAIHYQFTRTEYPAGWERDVRLVRDWDKQARLREEINTSTHRFSVSLKGANPAAVVHAEAPAASTENFYLPQCPEGLTGIRSYGRVVLENVYPNIDWIIYIKGNGLKYDFVVRPGGDPRRITLHVTDAERTFLSPTGELVMQTSLGEVRDGAPESFSDGRLVKTRFVRRGAADLYGISVDGYDKHLPLVIDPSVIWGTYYGTMYHDVGRWCATDAMGHVYVAGETSSLTVIASPGAHQTAHGGGTLSFNYTDAYLAKFDAGGSRLWATYYGGAGDENGYSCAVDNAGNVYLCGFTASDTAIASPGAHQTVWAGGNSPWDFDAFLVKFNGAGIRQWGTYYGGSGSDWGYSCATDAMGNVYLAGGTFSSTAIATPGSFQPMYAGVDAFLVKFTYGGARLWGTYFGGNGIDAALHCTKGPDSSMYITGYTKSVAGIASAGAHQGSFGGGTDFGDGFITRVSAGGARVWSTYFGGSGEEYATGAIADDSGNVFVTGRTSSATAVATAGSHQSAYGGANDAYLLKLSSGGTRHWSTYFGGASNDVGSACALDSNGYVYLVGASESPTGIATPGAHQIVKGAINDGYFTKFSSSGLRQWGTYYGGNGSDGVVSCAVSDSGFVYLAGGTGSTNNITTPNSYQPTGGIGDMFLVKFIDTPTQSIQTGLPAQTAYCGGSSLTVSFSLTGAFNPSNTFSAQLSNASGSFTSPTVIGTSVGTTAGTINATIPAGIPYGTGYRIRVVSSSPVVSGADNGMNMTIGQAPPGAISGAASVCNFSAGNSFIAALAPGAQSYSWTMPAGWFGNSTTNTISATAGAAGGIVSVVANGACGQSAPSTLTVGVVSTPPQPGSITGNDTVCAGTSALYSITPIPNITSYAWMVPTAWNGSSTGTSLTATAGLGGGNITVAAVNACGSGPVSTRFVLGGSFPIYTPSVSIAGPVVSCTGVPLTFTAAPTNGGPSPSYQWLKNGTATGNIGPTFTSNALQAGDVITVVMTSNAPCAQPGPVTSNAITVALSPAVATGINVNVFPAASLCAGDPATFAANIAGGGPAPQYQWYKNGAAVSGAAAFNFTDPAPADGDSVYCLLTSSAVCASPPTIISNKIGLTVLPTLTPSVMVSASPGLNVLPGQTVAFTAISTGGGNSPAFQWYKNGSAIGGATGPVYITNALQSGDVVAVRLTSDYACATTIQTMSTPVTVLISSGISEMTGPSAHSLSIAPNPAPGAFTATVDWGISFKPGVSADVSLVDVLGRCVLRESVVVRTQHWSKAVGEQTMLADGVYQLRIFTPDGMLLAPVIIKR